MDRLAPCENWPRDSTHQIWYIQPVWRAHDPRPRWKPPATTGFAPDGALLAVIPTRPVRASTKQCRPSHEGGGTRRNQGLDRV